MRPLLLQLYPGRAHSLTHSAHNAAMYHFQHHTLPVSSDTSIPLVAPATAAASSRVPTDTPAAPMAYASVALPSSCGRLLSHHPPSCHPLLSQRYLPHYATQASTVSDAPPSVELTQQRQRSAQHRVLSLHHSAELNLSLKPRYYAPSRYPWFGNSWYLRRNHSWRVIAQPTLLHCPCSSTPLHLGIIHTSLRPLPDSNSQAEIFVVISTRQRTTDHIVGTPSRQEFASVAPVP